MTPRQTRGRLTWGTRRARFLAEFEIARHGFGVITAGIPFVYLGPKVSFLKGLGGKVFIPGDLIRKVSGISYL
jgi:hypothetical protein